MVKGLMTGSPAVELVESPARNYRHLFEDEGGVRRLAVLRITSRTVVFPDESL